MFGGVVAGDVDRHQLAVGMGEDGPGTGREILKPRADAQDQIGFGQRGIGRIAPRHPKRSEVQRLVPADGTLARLGFGDRDVVLAGEIQKRLFGLRIDHAAACDDHGPRRGFQRPGNAGQFGAVGFGPADVPDARFEKARRIIKGLGLRVLSRRPG